MKSRRLISAMAVGLGVFMAVAVAAEDQKEYSPNDVIPLIVMEEVPLGDAIRAMGHTIHINYIIDPRLLNSDGSLASDLKVNLRWTNQIGKAAFERLLRIYRLFLAENLETGVARITRAEPSKSLAGVKQHSNGTNGLIPVIIMDEVPLDAALRKLATDAGTVFMFDSSVMKFKSSSTGQIEEPPLICVRWENITAWQALRAVVDNYDLSIKTNSIDGSIQIESKEHAAEKVVPPKKRPRLEKFGNTA